MQTDNSVPYPRPNYKDKDLLTKELINGTFSTVILNEIQTFHAPLGRYNVTEDDLADMSILKGNFSAKDYDISMTDMTIDGLKELSWLPTKRVSTPGEPLVVYDPLKHYSFVEWVGISSTELGDILSDATSEYDLRHLYYDDDNAGLFGFHSVKDAQGVATDTFAVFVSLKNYSMITLGRLGNEFDLSSSTFVGYTNGAFILNFVGGTYISFTLKAEVFLVSGYSDIYTALGDDGCIAILSLAKTFILDSKLNVVGELQGDFCTKVGGFSSSPTKYLFGTKLGNTYYFLRDNDSSYKFRNASKVWKAEIVNKRVWAYLKRTKYDYVTNNWLQKPLKTLKYNMIAQGLFVKSTMPPHGKEDEVLFPNSDMHGDFARVNKSNGIKEYWHTFNFKEWKPLLGEATTYLYGCMGRVWLKNRVDGVAGLMPYTIAVKTVSDGAGNYKTVLQYSGFIFRGGLQ